MENLVLILLVSAVVIPEIFWLKRDIIGLRVARDLKRELTYSKSAHAYDLEFLLNGVSQKKLYYLACRLKDDGVNMSLYNMFHAASKFKGSVVHEWLFRPTFYGL